MGGRIRKGERERKGGESVNVGREGEGKGGEQGFQTQSLHKRPSDPLLILNTKYMALYLGFEVFIKKCGILKLLETKHQLPMILCMQVNMYVYLHFFSTLTQFAWLNPFQIKQTYKQHKYQCTFQFQHSELCSLRMNENTIRIVQPLRISKGIRGSGSKISLKITKLRQLIQLPFCAKLALNHQFLEFPKSPLNFGRLYGMVMWCKFQLILARIECRRC